MTGEAQAMRWLDAAVDDLRQRPLRARPVFRPTQAARKA